MVQAFKITEPADEATAFEYVKKVMPKNWHVLTKEIWDAKDFKPGHLYINLRYWIDLVDKPIAGCVPGPLSYDLNRAAKITVEIYWPHQWQETILHELAHVAVDRWWSWVTHNFVLVNRTIETRHLYGRARIHDKIFKRALATFYRRAQQ